MSKTISEATKLILGKYNPLDLAVYCLLVTGIEESEHGEYPFTLTSLVLKMTYKVGRRPVGVKRNSIHRAVSKFWEDGLFEFLTCNQGTIARFPNGKPEWLSGKMIV